MTDNQNIIMQEDIPEELALRLIGSEKAIPHARYQMITSVNNIVIAQFDLSRDPSDEEYLKEYVLEEEDTHYEDNPTMSVHTFTIDNETPRINTTVVLALLLGGIFLLGLALLLYVMNFL